MRRFSSAALAPSGFSQRSRRQCSSRAAADRVGRQQPGVLGPAGGDLGPRLLEEVAEVGLARNPASVDGEEVVHVGVAQLRPQALAA